MRTFALYWRSSPHDEGAALTPHPQPTGRFFSLRIINFTQDPLHIDVGMGAVKKTSQRGVVSEKSGLVKAPHLGTILGGPKRWRKLPKKITQVGDIAHQHALGVVVACGINGLWQVNDHGEINAI
jgi:hypothetical protein